MESPPPTRQSLSPSAEEVLETMQPWLVETDQGMPHTEAKTRLEAAGFEIQTIDHALDQLLNQGYIYEVDSQLRLTEL